VSDVGLTLLDALPLPFHRVNEHKYSAVGKHLSESHNQAQPKTHEQFNILEKFRGKLECLIYEMLIIKEKRPNLHTQADPIPAKVFN